MLDTIAAVVENKPLTGGHFLISLHAPEQAQATRAGQFVMVRLLGRTDVILRRPMSVYDVRPEPHSASGGSTVPANRQRGSGASAIIQLLYKEVGRGTRLMGALQPGDAVGLLGPLGHGFFEEEYLGAARQVDEVVHVAGGIGIATLLLPARDLSRAGIRQKLFFGGRTQYDLVGVEDFVAFAPDPVLATEDGSRGHQGYVTAPLEAYLEQAGPRKLLLMVCGPWGMLRAAVLLVERYGHRCLVSMENRMGCGLGVCLGCSIRVKGEGHGSYQRVCTEGPVFWSDQVVWDAESLPKT
ncbi:MAG: dihydroorotate dehydrogenase electron transfer subunit [Terriglobia bacterium]